MQNFLRSTIMTGEYQNVASQAIHGNSRAVFISHFYFRYHTITCDMSNKTSIVRDCKRPWSESVGTQLTKSTKHEHSGREDKNHRNEIFFLTSEIGKENWTFEYCDHAYLWGWSTRQRRLPHRIARFFQKKIAPNYRIEACKKIHIHYRVTEFDKKSAIFAIVIISVIFILFQHK